MNQNPQNGKNPFSPETQAVIQRIQALIREREAATNAKAFERPDNPPPGVAPVVDTGPAHPAPSRPPRRATGPLRLKDLIPDVAIITKATHQLPKPERVPPPTPDLVARALERYHHLKALTPTARTLYQWLLTIGIARMKRMGVSPENLRRLTQVLVFIPQEAIMAALAIPERTYYHARQQLVEMGLIALNLYRVPAPSLGPGLFVAGTLFAVRLPHRDGTPKLYREDYEHPWRDLEADIQAQATVWRDIKAWYGSKGKANIGRERRKWLQEAKNASFAGSIVSPLGEVSSIQEYLVRWTLSPEARKRPLEYDPAKPPSALSLTALLQAKPADRRQMVEEIALGLAKEFRDPGSVRFYAWVLWNALRAEIYGYAPGAMKVVLWAIERVRMAVRSGGVRRPGALLATFLAEQGLMDLFRQAPSWRVA